MNVSIIIVFKTFCIVAIDCDSKIFHIHCVSLAIFKDNVFTRYFQILPQGELCLQPQIDAHPPPLAL